MDRVRAGCQRPHGADASLEPHPDARWTQPGATGSCQRLNQPDRIERIKGLVPMLRAGQPDEIAHAILWLLSDDASYTTGALLDVAGGR